MLKWWKAEPQQNKKWVNFHDCHAIIISCKLETRREKQLRNTKTRKKRCGDLRCKRVYQNKGWWTNTKEGRSKLMKEKR